MSTCSAYSGQEAIELAAKKAGHHPAFDVMMPSMDGFETCRRLKSTPETMYIPVVMVALDQQADRVSGLEAGADDFLTKPVEDLRYSRACVR
ncbi:MAG: response regulator [Parvularculaceae bacterium]